MAKSCCVCGDATDKEDNLLFTCKGHGCDVVVHQACYGILSVPGGQWFCRKCESQERAARVRCELCPKKEGALKRTDSGGWAHVVCALYIPEVTFLNNTKMEPIVTSKLPRERFSKTCYICEQKGQENNASYGAVMSCHKSSCRMAFHVTCAQKEQLLCEEEDSRDSGSLVYCGYCSTHYKKMIQKKLKQNLRKHAITPTSTIAPPIPSVSTETLTTVAQASPHSSGFPSFPSPPPPPLPPHHKEFAPEPLHPMGDHMRPHKTALGGNQTSSGSGGGGGLGGGSHGNQTHRPRNNKKEGGPPPQKRLSVDAPIPPAKRKNRRRKLSSSNESSTSEALSISSDFVHNSGPQSVDQGRQPLAGLGGERGEGGGGVGGGRRREELLHNQMDVAAAPHVMSPVDQSLNGGGGGGRGGGRGRENRTGGPPLSLQELLETQWQQTAQFILDQAGRQNNAGVMLEHLHKLQSENRTMQSRIMELASQREFYIAMNTRLRQTLADSAGNQLPNGIQTSGAATAGGGGGGGGGESMSTTNSVPQLASPDFHRSASGDRVSLPSPSPSLPAAPSSASSLSKQDQESLLTAHFLASSLPHNHQNNNNPAATSTHPPPPPPPLSQQQPPLPPSTLPTRRPPGPESPAFRQSYHSLHPHPPPPPPQQHSHDHSPFAPHHFPVVDPIHHVVDNEHRGSHGNSGGGTGNNLRTPHNTQVLVMPSGTSLWHPGPHGDVQYPK